MDIQKTFRDTKQWSRATSYDLKELLNKFGDIDSSLKKNFSSNAKRAYVEILIMLDDNIKYLLDLGQLIEKLSNIALTLEEEISINEIIAKSIEDVENSVDICDKILNSSPILLQDNLCMYYKQLTYSQQTFKENRENLYFFLLL